MAIRFHCSECRQLLSIARRKSGAEVHCPRCDTVMIVPTEEEAAELLMRETLARATRGRSRWHAAVDEPENVTAIDDWPSVDPAGPVLPPGVTVISRRTYYLQAAMLLLAVAIGFAAGFAVGRSQGTAVDTPPGGASVEINPQLVEGAIAYRDKQGQSQPDDGAVAIVVPADTPPPRPFAVGSLGPASPALPDRDPLLESIRQLGGDYARANADGYLRIVVARPGDYYVLLISRRCPRSATELLDEAALSQMGRYFASPSALLGDAAYRWGMKRIDRAGQTVDFTFSAPGSARDGRL